MNITNLDLSNNTSLITLDCDLNNLTILDVSNNINLVNLLCAWNSISSLDLSNNTSLRQLNCMDNTLTSLDLRNGNNQNFGSNWGPGISGGLSSVNNPNLNCVSVDDPIWAAANWTVGTYYNIDAHTSFSDDCANFNLATAWTGAI